MNKRRQSRPLPAARMQPNDPGQTPDPFQPVIYHIRIKGHLDDRWTDLFEGMMVTLEETGNTLLTVPVVDQAALYGLLRWLRDLGAPLVSINPAESGQPGNSSEKGKRR